MKKLHLLPIIILSIWLLAYANCATQSEKHNAITAFVGETVEVDFSKSLFVLWLVNAGTFEFEVKGIQGDRIVLYDKEGVFIEKNKSFLEGIVQFKYDKATMQKRPYLLTDTTFSIHISDIETLSHKEKVLWQNPQSLAD